MCTVSSVRWATCALAISIVVASGIASGVAPGVAFADRPQRSLAGCASFDQADRGEDRVVFTIHNACSIPVDCAVSWRVVWMTSMSKPCARW